jgi:hypothetical protein
MCAELSVISIKKKTLNTQGLQTCGLRVDILSIQTIKSDINPICSRIDIQIYEIIFNILQIKNKFVILINNSYI